MATNNRVFVPNIAKGAGSDDASPHMWALTRAMKKAGWKILASGDGLTKDTSKDPARDRLSPVENVAATQVWQVDDDAGPSFVDMTTEFNDASTGDVVPFPTVDAINDYFAIGRPAPFGILELDRIGGTIGSTGTLIWEYWNGSSWAALLNVVDDTNHFKAALANGDNVSWSIPDDWASNTLNAVPAYYIRARITLAYGTNPVISQGFITKPNEDVGTTSNTGGSASLGGATVRGRLQVTGLTGMTSASKGRFLLIGNTSGSTNDVMAQIEEVISANEVYVDARTFTFTLAEGNNGTLTWDEIDPTNEVYPTRLDAVSCWSAWQGPSIIKIPITAAPVVGSTGFTFIRGENVVQATTLAEGEILGFEWDGVSVGYLVISPRLIGTGGDPYGWGTTNVITGDTSGATVTQVGTALEYRHQVVLGQGTSFPATSGYWFNQCFEPVGEATEDFHTLAQSTGCTPTVLPGHSGAGNAFPLHAWSTCGGPTGTTYSAGATWHGSNSAWNTANGHAICMDAIWEEDWSADGTVIWAIANTGNYYGCRAFVRLDDTEPGDVTPFATFGISLNAMYDGANRNSANQSSSIGSANYMNTQIQDSQGTTHSNWRGWRRRGFPTEDAYLSMEMLIQYPLSSLADTPAIEANNAKADRVATALVETKAREPVRIGSVSDSHGKMRKGTVRHMTLIQGGQGNNTYDNGQFLQLSPTNGAFTVPWDGVTLPLIN